MMSSRREARFPLFSRWHTALSGARFEHDGPQRRTRVIAAEKLTEYLLNMSHKRGVAKARLLLGVWYRPDTPRLLESDLRAQHLSLDMTRTSENAYGVVYEIEGPIETPSGKTIRGQERRQPRRNRTASALDRRGPMGACLPA
jgi:hypothetical protein